MYYSESFLKAYADSLAITKSCSMQLNILDKSAKLKQLLQKKLSSKFSCYSCSIRLSTCWVLCDYLRAARNEGRKTSMLPHF